MLNITKPKIWLYVIAGLIFVYNLAILFASIGPILVVAFIGSVDAGLTLKDIKLGYFTYLNEISKQLQINITWTQVLFLLTVLSSILFIIIAMFLMLRRKWARYLLFILIGFKGLYSTFFILKEESLSFVNIGVDTIIYYFILILFFTRKTVIQLFES